MKFLVCHPGPQFSVHDVFVGWVEALHAVGQDVIEFNLNDRLTFYDNIYFNISEGVFRKAVAGEAAIELAVNGLYAMLHKTRPDVLLVVSAFLVPAELLDLARCYGTKIVILHTESPYEDERQLGQAAHADLNLLNDPVNLDRFTDIAPSVYMAHAYRETLHKPGQHDPLAASDFVFVGTGFESRMAFFEAMDLDGVDVALAGNWQRLTDDSPLRKYLAHNLNECCPNTESVRLYQSARAGVNLYRRETEEGGDAAGWAMSPREVEMAATGLFFLRDSRPEGDTIFPMLPTFTTAEDASDQLRWWLAHDDARLAAAAKARSAIMDRTFTNHAAALLRQLEE